MKLADWVRESQKRSQKRTLPRASAPATSPNLLRYSANFQAALADRNYAYGTLKLLADTDRISPVYNPYGKSLGRWCVFGADGWALERSNNLH